MPGESAGNGMPSATQASDPIDEAIMGNKRRHPVALGDPGSAVVSNDREANRAGARILRDGGNAFDAACAALLTQCVTRPGYVCLGGEVAALCYDAHTGTVDALSAVGAAPGDPAAIDWYLDHGLNAHGIASAAVPAIIDFCTTLLSRSGTTSFEAASAHALSLARAGQPVTYFDSVRGKTLHGKSGTVVDEDEPPPAGDDAWSHDLAHTLAILVEAERQCAGDREKKIEAVRDGFYRGEIAERLCQWYRSGGGLLDEFDLASHRTCIESPAQATIAGATVYKCGPWNQGPWVLQALRLLEHVDIAAARIDPGTYYHLAVESAKLCVADLNRYYGDPRFSAVPMHELLSDTYLARRAALVDLVAPGRAVAGDPLAGLAVASDPLPASAPTPGTTTCITRDRWGNIAVLSPSGCGSLAGSGGDTGVIHGTRLESFHMTTSHPNRIDMHKRPFMTPSPTLVMEHGRPVLAFAATGGFRQDQLALQVVLEFIHGGRCRHDLPMRRYLRDTFFLHDARPRGQAPSTVELNAGAATAAADLVRRGHDCRTSRRNMDSVGSSLLWCADGTGSWHGYGPHVDA